MEDQGRSRQFLAFELSDEYYGIEVKSIVTLAAVTLVTPMGSSPVNVMVASSLLRVAHKSPTTLSKEVPVTATRPSAPIQLAFQAAHPEHDTTWAPHAIVHVKLVVPGQGVFQDTLDGVRVRQFAPTRDLLERQTGRRFFTVER